MLRQHSMTPHSLIELTQTGADEELLLASIGAWGAMTIKPCICAQGRKRKIIPQTFKPEMTVEFVVHPMPMRSCNSMVNTKESYKAFTHCLTSISYAS